MRREQSDLVLGMNQSSSVQSSFVQSSFEISESLITNNELQNHDLKMNENNISERETTYDPASSSSSLESETDSRNDNEEEDIELTPIDNISDDSISNNISNSVYPITEDHKKFTLTSQQERNFIRNKNNNKEEEEDDDDDDTSSEEVLEDDIRHRLKYRKIKRYQPSLQNNQQEVISSTTSLTTNISGNGTTNENNTNSIDSLSPIPISELQDNQDTLNSISISNNTIHNIHNNNNSNRLMNISWRKKMTRSRTSRTKNKLNYNENILQRQNELNSIKNLSSITPPNKKISISFNQNTNTTGNNSLTPPPPPPSQAIIETNKNKKLKSPFMKNEKLVNNLNSDSDSDILLKKNKINITSPPTKFEILNKIENDKLIISNQDENESSLSGSSSPLSSISSSAINDSITNKIGLFSPIIMTMSPPTITTPISITANNSISDVISNIGENSQTTLDSIILDKIKQEEQEEQHDYGEEEDIINLRTEIFKYPINEINKLNEYNIKNNKNLIKSNKKLNKLENEWKQNSLKINNILINYRNIYKILNLKQKKFKIDKKIENKIENGNGNKNKKFKNKIKNLAKNSIIKDTIDIKEELKVDSESVEESSDMKEETSTSTSTSTSASASTSTSKSVTPTAQIQEQRVTESTPTAVTAET
ncbi:hypothetical protein B5S31_g5001 [[Candida] boidinii]|nr:hypothetical protein B5S31_g5001 [[Candida] boidinii]